MSEIEKNLNDDELIERIAVLSRPAYRGLSRIHDEEQKELQREAERRNLKLPVEESQKKTH